MAANSDWFRPLYRRVIVFSLCLAGLLVEVLVLQEEIWTYVWGGITAYAAYDFFLSGKYSG